MLNRLPSHRYTNRALLDIASYARQSSAHRDRLSPAEVEIIRRTVTRTPEVMVKVLSRGGQDLKAVQHHLGYLSRHGDLELETDDGEHLKGHGIENALLGDWDLDLDQDRRRAELTASSKRKPPKLVHKLMFSMPPGTPPDKVLTAVRHFAREEFTFKHRYALVLHTDEPHPHVHMVVKAVSEHGVRLNIRKATLRDWRSEFARHLRALGVQANATERAVRGVTNVRKTDGIYRAMKRGESTHMRERVQAAAAELAEHEDNAREISHSARLRATRLEVEQGWHAARQLLMKQGQGELSRQVEWFLRTMSPPRTEKEQLVSQLRQHVQKSDPYRMPMSRGYS